MKAWTLPITSFIDARSKGGISHVHLGDAHYLKDAVSMQHPGWHPSDFPIGGTCTITVLDPGEQLPAGWQGDGWSTLQTVNGFEHLGRNVGRIGIDKIKRIPIGHVDFGPNTNIQAEMFTEADFPPGARVIIRTQSPK